MKGKIIELQSLIKELESETVLNRFLGRDEKHRLAVAHAMEEALVALEQIPVRFGNGDPSDNQVPYLTYIELSQSLIKILSKLESDTAIKARRSLQRALIALQYRIQSANGGLSPLVIDPFFYAQIREAASKWKKSQAMIDIKILTTEDDTFLRETARYQAFVKLLHEDRDLQNLFFQWTLRDGLAVAIAVEYPTLHNKIVACGLNGRLARAGGNLLRVKRLQNEKHVILMIEGKEISILDDAATVTLKGDYVLTIAEVYHIFLEKNTGPGNLEVFADGVENWNSHHWGYWNTNNNDYTLIDFHAAAWWKQLPILEILSLEKARARYGHHMDGNLWNLAATATRGKMTLDPIDSHAFLEVAIPMGNSQYAIYAFGKFATRYATTAFDNILMFTDNLAATVGYPDENVYFSHRQHARYSFPVIPEEGIRFMESIREDMLQSLAGNFIYQWEAENCAKWTQDKLEQHLGKDRVPNLFRIRMLETEPSGPSKHLFSVLRLLPNQYQSSALSVLHYSLGAWRGTWIEVAGQRVWQSITTTHFWKDKEVYLPAMLHKQSAAGQFVEEGTNGATSQPTPYLAFANLR